MSSRATRVLLRLYPRRVRERYGEELLDLEDELTAHGEVSRARLIRDMLTGALLIRTDRRRARLITGTVLLLAALAVVGVMIGERSAGSPTMGAQPRAQLEAQAVAPYGACPVAAGRSCSLTPCAEFIDLPVDRVVGGRSRPTVRPRRIILASACPEHPEPGSQDGSSRCYRQHRAVCGLPRERRGHSPGRRPREPFAPIVGGADGQAAIPPRAPRVGAVRSARSGSVV